MNDLITQQMPVFDAGAASRQVERTQQQKRVSAVMESGQVRPRESEARPDESRGSGTEELARKIEQLNVQMQDARRSLRFSVDDSSGRIVVKVIDLSTEEVIRQIPSEEMMNLIRHAGDGDSLLFSDEA